MRTRMTALALSGLMIFGVAACSSDAATDTAPEDGLTAPAGDTGTTTDPALTATDPALTPTE
jgi:hypothetical protein